MSSREKLFVAALAFFFATAPAFADDTPQMINRFGQWMLSKHGDFIILTPSDGEIAISCSDSFMVYSVMIPVTDQSAVTWDAERKAHYFNFTAWSDAAKPYDFHLYLMEGASNADAMATLNPDPALKSQDTELWGMLKSARSRFAYSTKAGTVGINATDLPPAIDRFEKECAKIFIANAHKRLREPIPLDWLNR